MMQTTQAVFSEPHPRPSDVRMPVTLLWAQNESNDGLMKCLGKVTLTVYYIKTRLWTTNGCTTPIMDPVSSWVPTVVVRGVQFKLHYTRPEPANGMEPAPWVLEKSICLPYDFSSPLAVQTCACCGQSVQKSLSEWACECS